MLAPGQCASLIVLSRLYERNGDMRSRESTNGIPCGFEQENLHDSGVQHLMHSAFAGPQYSWDKA